MSCSVLGLSPTPASLPPPHSPLPSPLPLWYGPPSALGLARLSPLFHDLDMWPPSCLGRWCKPHKPQSHPPPIKPSIQPQGTPFMGCWCKLRKPLRFFLLRSRRISPGPWSRLPQPCRALCVSVFSSRPTRSRVRWMHYSPTGRPPLYTLPFYTPYCTPPTSTNP